MKTLYDAKSGVLSADFLEIPGVVPDSVMAEMLDAAADIIEPEIKKNADTLLNEKGWSIKGTLKSITRVKMKTGKEGDRYLLINFRGTRQDGKNASEIAFINEYGDPRKKMSARFFIQKALDAKGDEAVAAMEKVFREWQDKN